jgi:hypothetical protein
MIRRETLSNCSPRRTLDWAGWLGRFRVSLAPVSSMTLDQIISFMPVNPDEIKKREAAARAAIEKAIGTDDDEFGATLFLSHHLEELDSSYWKKHLFTETPDPHRVLELLELQSHWGGDDEIDTFDFTLPEEITNYIISVTFDESGDVSEITMES